MNREQLIDLIAQTILDKGGLMLTREKPADTRKHLLDKAIRPSAEAVHTALLPYLRDGSRVVHHAELELAAEALYMKSYDNEVHEQVHRWETAHPNIQRRWREKVRAVLGALDMRVV